MGSEKDKLKRHSVSKILEKSFNDHFQDQSQTHSKSHFSLLSIYAKKLRLTMVSPKLLYLLPFSTLALASAIATSCDPTIPGICPIGFKCDVIDCDTSSPTPSCTGRCVPARGITIPVPEPDPLPPVKPTLTVDTLSACTEVPEDPAPSIEYPPCGGFRIEPLICEDPDAICISDPRSGSCGMACDELGICVVPIFCGGIAAFECPKGMTCYDDPQDECDPRAGGADCGGICV